LGSLPSPLGFLKGAQAGSIFSRVWVLFLTGFFIHHVVGVSHVFLRRITLYKIRLFFP
jgi:hypothetical protein